MVAYTIVFHFQNQLCRLRQARMNDLMLAACGATALEQPTRQVTETAIVCIAAESYPATTLGKTRRWQTCACMDSLTSASHGTHI